MDKCNVNCTLGRNKARLINKSDRQLGLTLVELIVTLALGAIVMTMGVPSFSAAIDRYRLTSEVNRFVSHVQLARSEAMKRNQIVSMCRSNNGSSCGGTQRTYEDGWLLYADASGRDNNYHAANDSLIKVADAGAGDVTIRSNTAGNSWLSFGSTGMLAENGPAEYWFCVDLQSTNSVPGRKLTISLSGQPRLEELDNGDDCQQT